MRKTIRIALVSAVCLCAVAAAAVSAPVKFTRYPHVSNGKLVFAYHGDLWIANADGSQPSRLTAHVSRNTFPRLSPDGKWVAFTSNRMGNDDVWVIPSSGGEARQLTFDSAADTVIYWTPDGKRIIFASNRGSRPFGSPLYTVALEGGLPEPLPIDAGSNGMIKQDGSMLAFNRIGVRYRRKGYQGHAADDIYVQDLKTKKITQLTGTNLQAFRTKRQSVNPMWGADGLINFSSERDGIFNIWKISPTAGSSTSSAATRTGAGSSRLASTAKTANGSRTEPSPASRQPPTPRRCSTRRMASCTRWNWLVRRRRRRSTRP